MPKPELSAILESIFNLVEDMWIQEIAMLEVLVFRFGLSKEEVAEIQIGSKKDPVRKRKAKDAFHAWQETIREKVYEATAPDGEAPRNPKPN